MVDLERCLSLLRDPHVKTFKPGPHAAGLSFHVCLARLPVLITGGASTSTEEMERQIMAVRDFDFDPMARAGRWPVYRR
jgi:hypothetical protein